MRARFLLSALLFAAFACGGTSSTTTTTPDSGTPGTPDAATEASTPIQDAAAPDVTVVCTDCLADAVSWGYTGGLVIYSDSMSLSPCRTYERHRTQASDGGVTLSCSDEIGACAASPVAVGDVENALAHPDVTAAFAKSPAPIYGVDSRPVDGAILQIDRGGKSIYVGGDCGTSSAPACVPIPPGVKALATLLSSLDTQEIDKPACAAFK